MDFPQRTTFSDTIPEATDHS